MFQLHNLEPVDYLVIGHLTRDLSDEGPRLGGTAAYAALTAKALGLRVGIVTSWAADLPLGPLASIPIASYPSDRSTTFMNRYEEEERQQEVHSVAGPLSLYMIPEPWRTAKIVHLGPVAQEVDPSLVRNFSSALLGVTPQGWLRAWSVSGKVSLAEWPEASFVLGIAGAAIVSLEDVEGSEDRIEELASYSRILVVTEASAGARVYWHGDVRRFPASEVEEVDSTGAGDIFAASFLTRLYTTRDPWEAARFATLLSAASVTRPGLSGIPTEEEIQESLIEIF